MCLVQYDRFHELVERVDECEARLIELAKIQSDRNRLPLWERIGIILDRLRYNWTRRLILRTLGLRSENCQI